jgi:indole-3-glycerol phosphate synthase
MTKKHDFLTDILDLKKTDIQTLYDTNGLDFYKVQAMAYQDVSGFYDALSRSGLSLIAEIKKASPSKGLINPNFDPRRLAEQFKKAGAAVLSVLTEPHYFKGDPSFIAVAKDASDLPVLRKDFFIDEIQIYEAKALGADAILLILAILDNDKAQHLLSVAKSVGLDVLVEVHNAHEFERVLSLDGVKLIGVNNRNLTHFDVDTRLAFDLKSQFEDRLDAHQLLVAESGYSTIKDMERLAEAGFAAVLIGEGLVKAPELLSFFDTRSAK